MLVLEATNELQGVRDNDYHWADTGELVHLNIIDCSRTDCGCERGFAGLDSHRATTTARVVERPELTIEDLCQHLAESLHTGGWIPKLDPAHELVATLASEIVEMTGRFGVFGPGPILERDGEWVAHRLPPGVDAIDGSWLFPSDGEIHEPRAW